MTMLRTNRVAGQLVLAVFCFLCFGKSLKAQDGFCGFDVADACARQLGVPWNEGFKTTYLKDTPITSLADISDALTELKIEVFPTVIDSQSLATIRRIFADEGVVGVICVKSSIVDTSDTGVGHFLMVTGFASSDEIMAFDASNQEVRVVRLSRVNDDADFARVHAKNLATQSLENSCSAIAQRIRLVCSNDRSHRNDNDDCCVEPCSAIFSEPSVWHARFRNFFRDDDSGDPHNSNYETHFLGIC